MKLLKNIKKTFEKKLKTRKHNSGRQFRSIWFKIEHLFDLLLFTLSLLWSLMYTLGHVEFGCEIQIPI